MRQDEWRTRIVLEGKMHECVSFVTLTYGPEHLPQDYSLSKHHAQTWLKRLRLVIEPLRIRYFLCGEYGGERLRPHYHAIIFGYDFPDRVPWRKAASGEVSYRSELLERTWTLGHSEVGSFSPASAGYVAGYSIKKMTGEVAADHYRRMNPVTGEIHQVIPEFILASSRPGIGEPWLRANAVDVEQSTFVIIDGQKKPVPRYFRRKMEGDLDREGEIFLTRNQSKVIAQKGEAKLRANPDNIHWRRMQDREEYAQLQHDRRKPGELES